MTLIQTVGVYHMPKETWDTEEESELHGQITERVRHYWTYEGY